MHPALDQLQKIVKLELTNGYQNKAVIGGLPKMLVFWEPNARRAGLDSAFIDAMAAQLRAYPDLSAEARPAAVQEMLRMVRDQAGPAAPTATAPAPAAPPAPRLTERVERATLPPKAPPGEPPQREAASAQPPS